MIDNVLNLQEGYTTKKVNFETSVPNEMDSIPVVFEQDLPKSAIHKMKCSAIPVAIGSALTFSQLAQAQIGSTGLFNKLAPVLLPILYDAGRIVFYVNGAKAIYKISGGDTRGAIRQFKDVVLGYALLVGMDGIMYFIEYYVDGLKDGLLESGTQTIGMMINMLGGLL